MRIRINDVLLKISFVIVVVMTWVPVPPIRG